MFIEVLSASAGLNIDLLELRNLPYTQQLVDVMKSSLPLVTVSNVFINGIASGHGLVHLPLKVNTYVRKDLPLFDLLSKTFFVSERGGAGGGL